MVNGAQINVDAKLAAIPCALTAAGAYAVADAERDDDDDEIGADLHEILAKYGGMWLARDDRMRVVGKRHDPQARATEVEVQIVSKSNYGRRCWFDASFTGAVR